MTRILSDPDIDRNCSQLIESRGFVSESHDIITEDGYIITIFRIINSHRNRSTHQYPVYIQHGFFQNSDNWLIASNGFIDNNGIYREDNSIVNDCKNLDSVGQTLPFVLSSCGYDVWLGNIRGNNYSSHITLNPNETEFWNFSMDEFTKYDITTAIDHVLRVTNSNNIAYIGYSLGTTIMFQLLASKPIYSKIIKPFISLGPFVYLGHIRSPLLRATMIFQSFLISKPKPMGRLGSLSSLIGRYFCGFTYFKELCIIFGFLFGGFDYQQLNRTQIPRLFGHFPDGSSSIALSHVVQRIESQNFSYYNYNTSEANMRAYKQSFAPNYNISNIDSQNIVIMTGLNDWIADPIDVNILINRLNGIY
ncbi:lipase member J-like [Oppia nitens]|uniref:lipase member J-like n=1 Tax=Oppia nitens TaxID=1686743 RepID=UPI0023DAFE47|nr:lipase member J-like [Oppia nitens]